MSKKAIIIYGPTTSGKTNLALDLAKKFKTEIISADSRQVYTGLDIGAGKFSSCNKVEKHKKYFLVDDVKINLYDTVNPGKLYSVADFLKESSDIIYRAVKKNGSIIIAGGTGLYISSLLKPIETINIPPDRELRNDLSKLSVTQLKSHLKKINPQKFESLNPSDAQNPRRLIRAIELSLKPLVKNSSDTKSILDKFDIYFIYLRPDREYLKQRIKIWCQERVKMGLTQEVLQLKKLYGEEVIDSFGLVYREVSKSLNRQASLIDLQNNLSVKIYQFAKHQLLWFRNDPKINYYDFNEKNLQHIKSKIISDVLRWYNKNQ